MQSSDCVVSSTFTPVDGTVAEVSRGWLVVAVSLEASQALAESGLGEHFCIDCYQSDATTRRQLAAIAASRTLNPRPPDLAGDGGGTNSGSVCCCWARRGWVPPLAVHDWRLTQPYANSCRCMADAATTGTVLCHTSGSGHATSAQMARQGRAEPLTQPQMAEGVGAKVQHKTSTAGDSQPHQTATAGIQGRKDATGLKGA